MDLNFKAAEMLVTAQSAAAKSSFGLLAIGVFKLVKSVSLLALGIMLLRWRHEDVGDRASDWIDAIWIGRPYSDSLISRLSSLSEQTIEEVAAGSLVYSTLLMVEGVGLCLRKRWAEFLTVGIIASLLPFEFYELFRLVTPVRIFITL